MPDLLVDLWQHIFNFFKPDEIINQLGNIASINRNLKASLEEQYWSRKLKVRVN